MCACECVCVCVVTDVSSDVGAGWVCVVTDMSSGVEEEHSCHVAQDLWVSVEDSGDVYKGHWVKRDVFFCFCFVLFFQINVRVTTMDAELEFAIQPNTTGKQLFDQVGLCALERVSS